MQKIIGRKQEIEALRRCVESDRSEFVIVYGRRRVGKTFLVDYFFNKQYDFTYVGGHKLSKPKQLANFAKALKKAASLPKQPKFKDWDDAFEALEEYLDSLPRNKRKVVFIDEMPWIDTPQSDFVEALEYFWNSWASRREDIVFIASGSASSWMMDKLVDNPGGLHARITSHIYVRPFTLKETQEYLQKKGFVLEHYNILELYMIMGGIPFYLSLLDPKETLLENIDRLFFNINAPLASEFDELYNAIFKSADRYIEVVELLYKERKSGMTFDQIQKATGMNGTSLGTILKNLVRCDFIISYTQFGNKTKGTIYRLGDFYTLFYYKFIASADSKDEQWWTHNFNSHSVESWQGYTFELICLTHLPQIRHALGISGISTSSSSWRYKAQKNNSHEKGAQIDLVIERADRQINLCEIKFCQREYPITADYAERIRERAGLFKEKTKTNKSIVNTFITTYGVKKGMYSSTATCEVIAQDLFAI